VKLVEEKSKKAEIAAAVGAGLRERVQKVNFKLDSKAVYVAKTLFRNISVILIQIC